MRNGKTLPTKAVVFVGFSGRQRIAVFNKERVVQSVLTRLGEKKAADYHSLATERGFTWLGPEATNTGDKTGWQCQNGHMWSASFDNLKQGKGCPECYRNTLRLTADDYHSLAIERGMTWLGPEVNNTDTKTGWRCNCGYEWQTTYNSLKRGACPCCARADYRLKSEDYLALAAKRGFTWLGSEIPRSVTVKTDWRCGVGHQWKATYSNIQAGSGCPHCARAERRIAPEEYQKVALERGLTWLGPEVSTADVKTWWRCSQGHRWQATYHGLIDTKTGCRECYLNTIRLTVDDYELI